jgi:hypothetical protein
MRLIVVGGREIRLIGRDQRDAPSIGDVDQRRFRHTLQLHAVALQFDIEAIPEQAHEHIATRRRKGALPRRDRGIKRPARPAGQRDQAIGRAIKPSELDVRLLVGWRLKEGAGVEPHQAAITGCARRQ